MHIAFCLKVTLQSTASCLLHHSQDKRKKGKNPSPVAGIDRIAWSEKIHILFNLSF